MNVIIVNDYGFVNGGATKVAIETALLLADNNVNVIYFTAVEPIDERLINKKIKIVSLNQMDIAGDKNRVRAMLYGLWNWKAAKKLKSLLDTLPKENTVIHIHGIAKALSSSICYVAKKYNVSTIYHLHEYGIACPNMGFYNFQKNIVCKEIGLSKKCIFTNCDSRKYVHKIWRVIRQFIQKYIGGFPKNLSAVIYISDFSFKHLKRYIDKKTKCYFLPNMINAHPSIRVKAENNDIYLFIGRLTPEKNPMILAEAAEKNHIKVVFVGEGPLRKKLEKYDCAVVTGWQDKDNVKQWMEKSRCLIFPSAWYEGQPLVVMEAMVNGIPVISSDACAAVDMINDDVDGLIFKSNNVIDLERCLKKLKDNNIVRKYSNNIFINRRNLVEEKEYFCKLNMIYKDVLGFERK